LEAQGECWKKAVSTSSFSSVFDMCNVDIVDAFASGVRRVVLSIRSFKLYESQSLLKRDSTRKLLVQSRAKHLHDMLYRDANIYQASPLSFLSITLTCLVLI
jgi:hypothetical protein